MSARLEKRLAIIGAGRSCDPYLEALQDLPELVLDSVVAPRSESIRSLTEQGLRSFAAVSDLVRYRAIPDVALLDFAPGKRLDAVIPLLCAGVDVVVLPPLATTAADAKTLAELASRAGRELVTGGPLRQGPALRATQRAIRAGRIGELRSVEIVLAKKLEAHSAWRTDPELSGGGVWAEIGPHGLDAVELLAGPVRRIRMLRSDSLQRTGVEDEVCAETDHGDGRLCCIRGSWNHKSAAPVARCVGDAGEILVGESRSLLRTGSGTEVLGAGCDERSASSAVLAEFLHRRCTRDPAPDHGPRQVRWIQAAYRSVRDQRWQAA